MSNFKLSDYLSKKMKKPIETGKHSRSSITRHLNKIAEHIIVVYLNASSKQDCALIKLLDETLVREIAEYYSETETVVSRTRECLRAVVQKMLNPRADKLRPLATLENMLFLKSNSSIFENKFALYREGKDDALHDAFALSEYVSDVDLACMALNGYESWQAPALSGQRINDFAKTNHIILAAADALLEKYASAHSGSHFYNVLNTNRDNIPYNIEAMYYLLNSSKAEHYALTEGVMLLQYDGKISSDAETAIGTIKGIKSLKGLIEFITHSGDKIEAYEKKASKLRYDIHEKLRIVTDELFIYEAAAKKLDDFAKAILHTVGVSKKPDLDHQIFKAILKLFARISVGADRFTDYCSANKLPHLTELMGKYYASFDDTVAATQYGSANTLGETIGYMPLNMAAEIMKITPLSMAKTLDFVHEQTIFSAGLCRTLREYENKEYVKLLTYAEMQHPDFTNQVLSPRSRPRETIEMIIRSTFKLPHWSSIRSKMDSFKIQIMIDENEHKLDTAAALHAGESIDTSFITAIKQ